MMVCKDCNSIDIGFDAIVDKYGDPVRIYDSCECLECGSTNIEENNA